MLWWPGDDFWGLLVFGFPCYLVSLVFSRWFVVVVFVRVVLVVVISLWVGALRGSWFGCFVCLGFRVAFGLLLNFLLVILLFTVRD